MTTPPATPAALADWQADVQRRERGDARDDGQEFMGTLQSADWATPRDLFAAAALVGVIAREGLEGSDPAFIARAAFEMADAMMAARRQAEGESA